MDGKTLNYARRFAQLIMEEQKDEIFLELPDDRYRDEVVDVLEEFGHRVAVDPIHRGRITIYRRASAATGQVLLSV
jgi:hypothetical protein